MITRQPPLTKHDRAPSGEVLLLANYEPEAQWSMLNFAQFLADELPAQGAGVRVLRPPARFGGSRSAGKWIRYADKFLLFLPELRRAARAAEATGEMLHICDHSNALYLHAARPARHVVTCHDLIAVRTALGEFPGTGTGWSGRILQWLILSGLRKAHFIVCDSHSTRRDLALMIPELAERLSVVHLSLDTRWRPLAVSEARAMIAPLTFAQPERPVIFHLGANCWYKNWDGVLRIFARVIARTARGAPRPLLVLGSGMLTEENRAWIREQGLEADVLGVGRLTPEQIHGLYALTGVFLFPSRYEGFGWPPLEAQACECPVVCSQEGSLAEIVEESALTAHPDDEATLAAHVEALLHNVPLRAEMIQRGLGNAARFTHARTVVGYLAAYAEARALPPRAI